METETIMAYLAGVGFLFFIVGFLAGKIAGVGSQSDRRRKDTDEDSRSIPGIEVDVKVDDGEGKVDVKVDDGDLYSGNSYAPVDQANNGDRFYIVLWKAVLDLTRRIRRRKRGVRVMEESEAMNLADALSSRKV